MMGLFPNPGQDVYLITPPYFESVSITSTLTNNTATISNVNFDPNYKDIYIQSATLDGEPYTKNWIDHSFFTEGKQLVLTLGASESTWGTLVADLPPSLGQYVGFGNGTATNATSAYRKRVLRFMEFNEPNMEVAVPKRYEGFDAKTGGSSWASPAG